MTPTTAYDYRAIVVYWVDGDTVKVAIDLGFEVTVLQTVRLAGINTPELRNKDVAIRQAAILSREAARCLAPEGSIVRVQSKKGFTQEKYGRYLAVIHTVNGLDISQELISKGYGVPYMS